MGYSGRWSITFCPHLHLCHPADFREAPLVQGCNLVLMLALGREGRKEERTRLSAYHFLAAVCLSDNLYEKSTHPANRFIAHDYPAAIWCRHFLKSGYLHQGVYIPFPSWSGADLVPFVSIGCSPKELPCWFLKSPFLEDSLF